MNIDTLYQQMAENEEKSSNQKVREGKPSHTSVQPVKVASHHQFHDNVAPSVSQRTH